MSDQSLYLLTEAAERTGLTVEAIRQRIKRGRLEAVKGNDGLLRVRLTTADLESIINRSPAGQVSPTATGQAGEDDRLTKELQAEAAALRERVGRAEGESAILREQMESERDRAGKAEAERDAARAEVAAERARAAKAEVQAATAEGEAKGLREALAEARRPFWRRWLGP
jgi:chromosome segregation ATPase